MQNENEVIAAFLLFVLDRPNPDRFLLLVLVGVLVPTGVAIVAYETPGTARQKLAAVGSAARWCLAYLVGGGLIVWAMRAAGCNFS